MRVADSATGSRSFVRGLEAIRGPLVFCSVRTSHRAERSSEIRPSLTLRRCSLSRRRTTNVMQREGSAQPQRFPGKPGHQRPTRSKMRLWRQHATPAQSSRSSRWASSSAPYKRRGSTPVLPLHGSRRVLSSAPPRHRRICVAAFAGSHWFAPLSLASK